MVHSVRPSFSMLVTHLPALVPDGVKAGTANPTAGLFGVAGTVIDIRQWR
jgi:hypothetical protein